MENLNEPSFTLCWFWLMNNTGWIPLAQCGKTKKYV